MHSAPAVSFTLERSRFHGWFLAIAWLTGAMVSVYGCVLVDVLGWRQYAALALVVALGASTIWAWRKPTTGTLQWDGQCWRFKSPSTSVIGTVTVHLDLQFFLLLRLRSESGGVFWLWLDRPPVPSQWEPLRRAVFSPRQAEAATTSGGEPDKPTSNSGVAA